MGDNQELPREDAPDQRQRMQTEGLPVTHTREALPFPDKLFDAAICIEVLEHVPRFEAFLAELSRVSSRVAVFSVPNFGAAPVTGAIYAWPWRMLECDHQKFLPQAVLQRFYRHVETFEYGPLSLLKSADGIAINNHIFAVCQH